MKLMDTAQTLVEPMIFFGNCALAVEYQPAWQLKDVQEKWKNVSKLVKDFISAKKEILDADGNIRSECRSLKKVTCTKQISLHRKIHISNQKHF